MVQNTLNLVFVAVIWGSTYCAIKLALQDVDTFLLITYRSAIATIFGFLTLQGIKTYKSEKHWIYGAIPGAILFLTFLAQTYALNFTTPTRSAFFTSLSFLFVPIFTYLFERKGVQSSYYMASILGVFGLSLLYNPDFQEVTIGDFLTLLGAFGYAAYFYSVKIYRSKIGLYKTYMMQMITIFALSLPFSLANKSTLISRQWSSIAAILFIGLFGTGVSYYLLIKAQKTVSPERTSFILALETVFAGVFSYILFSEKLSAVELLGCGLILLAVLFHEKVIKAPKVSLKSLGRLLMRFRLKS